MFSEALSMHCHIKNFIETFIKVIKCLQQISSCDIKYAKTISIFRHNAVQKLKDFYLF